MSEENMNVTIETGDGEKVETDTDTIKQATENLHNITSERLRQFIERIERLEEEKAALGDDIKDVYAEAKSAGFDTKTMRKIVKIRKMEREKVMEERELLDTYASALGMQYVMDV